MLKLPYTIASTGDTSGEVSFGNTGPNGEFDVFGAAALVCPADVRGIATGGYPALFTDAGFTHAQIDLARASITLEYGPRATIEGNGLAFIAAQGYEIIPEAV